jgi:hypothetical protein
MFDKVKDLGTQVSTRASDAVDGITSSVKSGVESLGNAVTGVGEAINEKAVRASTAQACRILEIAMEEMQGRPLQERPVSLTATVNFGIAALEMQVHLPAAGQENENDVRA